MKQSSLTIKRNYISLQKTQKSIVAFSNQKKQNSNITPLRTAIEWSVRAITAPQNPKSPPKNLALSNNPYKLLADQEESADADVSITQEIETNEAFSKAIDVEGVSVSSEGLSSPEKVLFSRKAQQALHKIRSARRVLMDNSVRAEIEAAYGVGCVDSISQEMLPSSANSLEQPVTDVDMTNGEDDVGSISTSTSPTQQPLGPAVDPSNDLSSTTAASIQQPEQPVQDIAHSDNNPAGSTQTSCNIYFAEAEAPKTNSHLLRKGNLQGQPKTPPHNPYAKKTGSGILFAQRTPQLPARDDKLSR